jgi:hypothetical protein
MSMMNWGQIVLYNRILLLIEKVLNRLLITEMPVARAKKAEGRRYGRA